MQLRRPVAAVALAGLVTGGVVVIDAQDPPAPTFRSSVQLVEVDASVIDSRGHFVAGLTQDDFEVLEDGVVQRIESLSVQGLPAPAAGAPIDAPGAPAARGSLPPRPAADAGRERNDYVVIFDSGDTPAQQKVAEQFIRRTVRPGDRVALVETKMGLPAALPFTDSRDAMLAAVRQVSGFYCPTANEESFWMLRDVIARLSREQGGRPSVVFITMGTPLLWSGIVAAVPTTLQPAAMDVVKATRRAFEEAARMAVVTRVPVHAVHPAGLRGGAVADVPRDAASYFTGFQPGVMPDPASVNPSLRSTSGRDRAPVFPTDSTPSRMNVPGDLRSTAPADMQSSVRQVAEVSGGMDIVNTNDFGANFTRLAEERPIRYLLSYTSAANQRDGKYHALEVKVKRAGLKVKARRGYYAFRPGGAVTPAVPIPEAVSPRARAAIEAERLDDVAATARAASLSIGQSPATVLVGLQVERGAVAFDPARPIELVWSATNDDGYGALTAVERRTIPPAPSPAGDDRPWAAFDRLLLTEGRYVVTGVASQENGPVAVARTMVDVQSRPTEPYGFTDIVLAASAGENRHIAYENKEATRLLPYAPAVTREFDREGTLALYTEFHDVSEWFEKLTLRASVSSPRTGVVMHEEKVLTFKGTNPEGVTQNPWRQIPGRRIQYSNSIPLSKLQPGSYTLTLVAVGSGARSVTQAKQVPFTVR